MNVNWKQISVRIHIYSSFQNKLQINESISTWIIILRIYHRKCARCQESAYNLPTALVQSPHTHTQCRSIKLMQTKNCPSRIYKNNCFRNKLQNSKIPIRIIAQFTSTLSFSLYRSLISVTSFWSHSHTHTSTKTTVPHPHPPQSHNTNPLTNSTTTCCVSKPPSPIAIMLKAII